MVTQKKNEYKGRLKTAFSVWMGVFVNSNETSDNAV